MKPFRFRLESILTLRTREEERARDIFAAAMSRQVEAARALAEGQANLEACHSSIATQRSGRTTRSEQILLLSALQQQQTHCERLVARCSVADRELAVRRGEFLAARRKREALTNLKKRQREAHQLEVDRQQEATIADLISARHVLNMQEAQT